MELGKAGGEDAVVAEYLRYAGDHVRAEIYALVKKHWDQAASAPDGQESAEWPPEWTIGLVCPLWKKKGDPKDKTTWRGVVLLSVGSKLMLCRSMSSSGRGTSASSQNVAKKSPK